MYIYTTMYILYDCEISIIEDHDKKKKCQAHLL